MANSTSLSREDRKAILAVNSSRIRGAREVNSRLSRNSRRSKLTPLTATRAPRAALRRPRSPRPRGRRAAVPPPPRRRPGRATPARAPAGPVAAGARRARDVDDALEGGVYPPRSRRLSRRVRRPRAAGGGVGGRRAEERLHDRASSCTAPKMWSKAAGSASRSRTPATSAFVFRGTRVLTSSSGSVVPSGATSLGTRASRQTRSPRCRRPTAAREQPPDSKAHRDPRALARVQRRARRGPAAQCARQPCIAATSATE